MALKDTEIIIDPLVNVNYASFYIYGLEKLFGKKNIHFKSHPFEMLEYRESCLNFIIKQSHQIKKYTVDFNDFNSVKQKEYDWCDVYGHVNANFGQTPVELTEKLVSLVPSFGIRIWNKSETFKFALFNVIKIWNKANIRKFLGKYKKQLMDRVEYENYTYDEKYVANPNYVFHLSTLWQNDEWNKNDEQVNLMRYYFISACKKLNELNFEGGLSVDGENYNPLFEKVVYKGRISMKEYLDKTKKSLVVFNTPAFWNCNGWKLGEYLALGKAIISTKLVNNLPVPLEHGKNIHFVEGNEEAISEAVLLLMNDSDYRMKLERGAKEYWEENGTPVKSLNLMGIF